MTEINFDIDTSAGYPIERTFDADREVWLRGSHMVGWMLWVADNWQKAADLKDPSLPSHYCEAVALGLRSAAKHLLTIFDDDPSLADDPDVASTPGDAGLQQPETD